MALKYEKPLIVPLNSPSDETGLGHCQAGQSDTQQCKVGTSAQSGCKVGNNPL
jgi:hypothetical protein